MKTGRLLLFVSVNIVSKYYTDSNTLILKLIKLGADGYLPKERGMSALVHAIHEVFRTGYYFEDKFLEIFEKRSAGARGDRTTLNTKERMLLTYFCKDMSYKEIIERTGLSINNVGHYRMRIFHKTGAQNIKELIEYAVHKWS